MRILVVDDQEIFLSKYEEMLNQIKVEEGIEFSIDKLTNGEDVVEYIKTKPYPDMIYLDIIMGKMDGVESAKIIRKEGYKNEIIFLTSSEEYVFESFNVAPADYILKDSVTYDGFKKEFLKYYQEIISSKEDAINVNGQMELISRIDYIKDNKIRFGDTSEVDYMLEDKSRDLLVNRKFLEVDRNTYINLRIIERVDKGKIILNDKSEISIDERVSEKCKQRFLKYLTEDLLE